MTNAGNVLESVSDGFTVDTDTPNITLDRFVEVKKINKTFYAPVLQSSGALSLLLSVHLYIF